jgi:hypothetical protein
MPKIEDTIDIKVSVQTRQLVGPNEIDVDIVPKINPTLKMSWAVLDLATSTVEAFDVEGGHFQSVQGHRYIIFVRAADVRGVQRITLDGSGMFRCATEPDANGNSYNSPSNRAACASTMPLRLSAAPKCPDRTQVHRTQNAKTVR